MAGDLTDLILQVSNTIRRASNFAPIGDIAEVMSALISIVNAVIKQVQTWNTNSESSQLIISRANSLMQLLEDLGKLASRYELPPSFLACLERLHNRLIDCYKYCDDFTKRSKIKALCLAGIVHPELQVLDDLLSQAIHDATLAVSTANLSVFVDYLYEEPYLQGVTLYENRRASSNECNRPAQVNQPTVAVDCSMLTVKWSDSENTIKNLLAYDIQYRKGRRKSTTNLPPPKSVTLELPPGAYSLQVRAVNVYGPGPWSEATDVHMEGVPHRPSSPRVRRLSLKAAVVNVATPPEKEGRSSTVLVLQLRALCTGDSASCPPEAISETSEWLSQEFEYVPTATGLQVESLTCIKGDETLNRAYHLRSIPRILDDNSHAIIVANLHPRLVYQFRVKLKNRIGTSDPSDSATADFIPGPMQFMYIAKRTHNLVELHWGPPKVLPEAVVGYEVEKRCRGMDWEVVSSKTPTTQSLVVTGLDARTAYFFRVCGITATGEKGPAVEIYAKTRMHVALKSGILVGTFIGGTLCAPIIAPVDHQIYLTRVMCNKGKNHNVPVGIPIATSLSVSPVFFIVDAAIWTLGCPAYGGILAYRVCKGKSPFVAIDPLEPKVEEGRGGGGDREMCETRL